MEKAQEIAPEAIVAEAIVAEAKEAAKEAPPRLREKLRELEAMWERARLGRAAPRSPRAAAAKRKCSPGRALRGR